VLRQIVREEALFTKLFALRDADAIFADQQEELKFIFESGVKGIDWDLALTWLPTNKEHIKMMYEAHVLHESA